MARLEGNASTLRAIETIRGDDYVSRVQAADEDAETSGPNCVRVETIKDWLQDCDNCHQCTGTHQTITESASNFVPPRLLFIGTDARHISLIVTEESATREDLTYTTLSYCWGSEKPFRLTENEFHKLTTGVPIHDLGRVFSDAIYLSYQLGVRHIWIDSLCIVQDSPNHADWLRHTPLMHLIYGSSYLNIAASASNSWDEDLWRRLDAIQVYPLTVNLPNGTSIYSRDPGGKQVLHADNKISWGYRDARLFERSWCVQEFLFSRRNLYMAKSQIFWQCREKTAAEVSKPIMYAWRHILKDQAHSQLTLDLFWAKLVTDFAYTKVTFARDRVHALESAANWFKQEYRKIGVETKYLVGHWEHSVRESILWSGSYFTSNSADSSSLFLPSWSWMNTSLSLALTTRWAGNSAQDFCRLDKFLVELESTKIELQNTDHPFGLVRAGSIHFRGPLFRLRYAKEDSSESEIVCDSYNYARTNVWLTADYTFENLDDGSIFEIPEWNQNSATSLACRVQRYGHRFNLMGYDVLKATALAPIAYSNANNGICQVIYAIALEPCDSPTAGAGIAYKHCGVAVFSASGPRWNGWDLDLEEMIEDARSHEAKLGQLATSDGSDGVAATSGQRDSHFEQSYRVVDDMCEFIKKSPKQSFYLV